MENLAIFGGTPVRENPIYYGRQFIDQDDINAVVETLRSEIRSSSFKWYSSSSFGSYGSRNFGR